MSKYFIITVDTEGDNLWHYHTGDIVKTHNTQFIPRFQDLCSQYEFLPVYLTNYEMIKDDDYVNYIKRVVEKNQCEVGIHVHAWNNPPLFDLGRGISDNTYLIEYPFDVMKQKFATTYNLIKERIGMPPVSHRAGRWAMNEAYFQILKDYNILVDCSHTPHIDWSSSKGYTMGGPDYRNVNVMPSLIDGVLEVPVSILTSNKKIKLGLKSKLYYYYKGLKIPRKVIWLRPAQSPLSDMKKLVEVSSKNGQCDYLEFMVHSSELMPGGSPYFPTKQSIEKLYSDMESFFCYVRSKGYEGCTLKQYRFIFEKKINEKQ